MKKAILIGTACAVFAALSAWSIAKSLQDEVPLSHGGARQIQPPRADLRASLGDKPRPGVYLPVTVPADQATVAGNERVIGIVVDGRPRAYLVSELFKIDSHLVHDTIGQQHVSISFCGITGFARCFRAPASAGQIDLQLAGFMKGEMHFVHADRYYSHSSPDLPYDGIEFTETSWSTWRKTHPTTDVYVGPVSRT